MIKAGKFTAALALIAVGGLLFADLLFNTSYTADLIRWWPVLLILLGIEYLILSALHRKDDSKIGFAVGSVLLAAVLLVFAAGYHQSEKFKVLDLVISNWGDESGKSYDKGTSVIPFDGSYRKVVLRNPNGNVELRAGDTDDIRIHTTVYVSFNLSAEKADQIAEQSKISYRGKGGTLEIEAGGKEYRVLGIRQHPRMNLVVTVPRERRADFELLLKNGGIDAEGINVEKEFLVDTTNGRVNISRIDGTVKVDTTNGSIAVSQIQGDVYLDTTNGRIEARDITGDVEADTTNGTIIIEQVGGDVKADTTNGKVTMTDVRGKVTADTTNGAITIQSRTIGGDWHLETTNGGITVSLPRDASFEVQGETARHQTPESDFSLSTEKGKISGKVNGGGPKITMDTNGKIELRYLP